MNDVVSYILGFLIGGDKVEAVKSRVGYTADHRQFHKYRVVIIPASSICAGKKTEESPFTLPLQEIEGVPLLFGTPKVEWYNATWVVHADIIAGSFYLLSRYEEVKRRNVRDAHGRFPGKESLPYRAGFIHRPVVDEYGKLLRGWLRKTGIDVPEPESRIQKIWLTHDVDAPFYCRSIRNVVREIVKGNSFSNTWEQYKKPLEEDPFYTFPRLAGQANSVRQSVGNRRFESVFFIKAGGNAKQDKPVYNLYGADMQALFELGRKEHIAIGLHSSYTAGIYPKYISKEKENLQKASGQRVFYNRHHYLSLREQEDNSWLERAGITDDFTMGYPDVAGFRLGTCRPVHWINPVTRRISSLVLHPLTVMDVSLSEPQYMGLDYDKALEYCLQLINRVEEFGGELVLLWHNDIVTAENIPASSVNWHRKLYAALVEDLKKR